MGELESWVQSSVESLLGFPTGDGAEVATYILSQPVGSKAEESDFRAYVSGWLGESKEAQQFVGAYLARRKAEGRQGKGKGNARPPATPQPKPPTTEPKATGAAPVSARTASVSASSSSMSFVAAVPEAARVPQTPAERAPIKSTVRHDDDFWGSTPPAPPTSSTGGGKAGRGDGGGEGGRKEIAASAGGQGRGGGQQGRGRGKGREAKDAVVPSQTIDVPASEVGGKKKKGGRGGGGRGQAAPQTAPPGLTLAGGERGIGAGGGGAAGIDALLPEKPRPKCKCMGTAHKALGNCLRCGKIACEVEGWSTCTFCGADLSRCGYRSGSSKPKASTAEQDGQAPKKAYGQTLEDAVALKDKLLMFDRTVAERSRVYDDQADYYSNTDWLSEKEKEDMEAKEIARQEALHTRRRDVTVSIDLAGRRVVLDGPDGPGLAEDQADQDRAALQGRADSALAEMDEGLRNSAQSRQDHPTRTYENSSLSGRAKEIYQSMTQHFNKVKARRSRTKVKGRTSGPEDRGVVALSSRLQHDELLEGLICEDVCRDDGGVEERKGGGA